MEDFLLRSQIHESCCLALPEGLKDLMSDISREVLRAQPTNLYQFITDYLAALLVARTNLTIASRLCDDVCDGDCNPELDDELRYIGLSVEDATTAKDAIITCLESGEVNESNLMIKIMKKIKIEGSQLQALKEAVGRAFQRHLINNTTIFETSSDSDLDDVARAAKHTLHLYRKTKHTSEAFNQAAEKIQASYRAYGVRRQGSTEKEQERKKLPQKAIRFSADITSETGTHTGVKSLIPHASSTSLAGSYLKLPRFVPYSPHESFPENDRESMEKESATVFYTDEECSSSTNRQNISFQESLQELVEDHAVLADDESEATIEDVACETDNDTENTETADDHFDKEVACESDNDTENAETADEHFDEESIRETVVLWLDRLILACGADGRDLN